MLPEAGLFYDENLAKNNRFCTKMQGLIETLIEDEGIDFHSVSGRVKNRDSFLKKCEKDKYKDVTQITDLIGVRVIAYLRDDVEKVCKLIEREFTVDSANSDNKADALKENEVGYLSVHYILKLNSSRQRLREYRLYSDMCFELQIRTLLQHAWAEFSHDRIYKFAGVPDRETKRSLFITAGTLEMMDNEFQRIADALSKYEEDVKERTDKGDLDIEINSTSLMEYLSDRFDSAMIEKTFNNGDREIVQELMDFDIKTIEDLAKIIPVDYVNRMEKSYRSSATDHNNFIGMLRDFMIIKDAEKYFDVCWKDRWKGLDRASQKLLASYSVDVDRITKKYLRA